MNAFEMVNALTDKQRNDALDAARKRIVGAEPSTDGEPMLDNYQHQTFTKYPPELIQRMRQFGYVILGAAFFASALRIFMATFEMTTYVPALLAVAIAAMSVLLAESGQVAFTLWAATTEGRVLRGALWLGALGCTAFALVANAAVIEPWNERDVLAWIETFLPPVLVLIASHVLKSQSLHEIEERHQAKLRFEADHREWSERIKEERKTWTDAYDNAHLNPRWMHYAAHALRDALIAANGRKTAILRELMDGDWRALVLRELDAENWYERSEQRAAEALVQAEQRRIEEEMRLQAERTAQEAERERKKASRIVRSTAGSGGVRTGETDGAVRDNGDGTFTATCPYCAEAFVRDTQKGATNALPGHFRKCAVRKTQLALQSATPDGIADALQDAVNGQHQ